jgi:DNA-binding response OmpR family regulator
LVTALVIEDDQDILSLLHHHLITLGYQVEVARTAELGVDLARANPPDVVVVDIVLPGQDGRWVIRQLKADATTRHCRIIVTSMLDTEDLPDEDVDGVLLKPFDRAMVHRVFGRLSLRESPWRWSS